MGCLTAHHATSDETGGPLNLSTSSSRIETSRIPRSLVGMLVSRQIKLIHTYWSGRSTPPGSSISVFETSDADHGFSAPNETIQPCYLDSVTHELRFGWDNRQGTFTERIVANAIFPDRWHSISLQKSAGANNVRVYLDGVLRITENIPNPLNTLDMLLFRPGGSNNPIIRELSIRTNTPLPEIPFSPGGVRFDIGDPHLRWNSYML